jgi:DNA-binding transcriptional LysR family regulator
MHFDLFDLDLFASVADTGSITAAAKRHHIALAAASSRLQKLEATLGATLLVREHRGVSLTAAGRTLLHHALDLTRRANRMREAVSGHGAGWRGHLRILANTTAISASLPPLLGTFLAAHPEVGLDLEERLSGDIVRAVGDGRADLGVVAGDTPAAGLRFYPYRHDTLVAVVPPGHPLARRRGLAFAELLDYPFVTLGAGSAIGDFLERAATRHDRPLQVRVRLRGFDGVCRMVAANVGVAVLPGAVARLIARPLELPVIPLSDPWAERNLQLCVPAGEPPSPLLQRLIEHLVA